MPDPTPSIPLLVGWVLYDGTCGFCSQFVPRWSATFTRLGLVAVPLQEPWVAERARVPPEELMRDVCILIADGTLIRGADAYRWVLRRRWWGLPFWLLAAIPPTRWLFDLGYRVFARNRHRVSQVCRLRPAVPPNPPGAGS